MKFYLKTKFHINPTTRGDGITSYWFSRWQPRRRTLFPVSYVMPLSSKGQYLPANQISSIYLNPRKIYNYFRLEKQPSAIGILFPVSISTISPYSSCHCALDCRISSKSVHPQRRYNVTSIFKMAAAAAQFYFRFQIGWRRSFSDVSFYQQTKFYSYSSLHSWDITIFGLEKQTFAILEFYFRFRSRPYHPIGMSLCTSLRNFIQIRRPKAEKWRQVNFQGDGSPPSWILGVQ